MLYSSKTSRWHLINTHAHSTPSGLLSHHRHCSQRSSFYHSCVLGPNLGRDSLWDKSILIVVLFIIPSQPSLVASATMEDLRSLIIWLNAVLIALTFTAITSRVGRRVIIVGHWSWHDGMSGSNGRVLRASTNETVVSILIAAVRRNKGSEVSSCSNNQSRFAHSSSPYAKSTVHPPNSLNQSIANSSRDYSRTWTAQD